MSARVRTARNSGILFARSKTCIFLQKFQTCTFLQKFQTCTFLQKVPDVVSETLTKLAMGFGAGLEHHDAGVFRHPTKRKICRTSALMATGAFSFRPPSLPMARAEMHRKSRRVYGNGHGVGMTTQSSWIAERKS